MTKCHFILCGWLPFCKSFFRAWYFVRSSLVFPLPGSGLLANHERGLLARRTLPLALMVSTNQVPFRTSNSKRSGQSSGRLGFRADLVPSRHWSCKLLFLLWSVTQFSLYRVHFVSGQPRSFGRFCWPWQRQRPCLACETECPQTMDQTFLVPT